MPNAGLAMTADRLCGGVISWMCTQRPDDAFVALRRYAKASMVPASPSDASMLRMM
jgi:hypothetical protein